MVVFIIELFSCRNTDKLPLTIKSPPRLRLLFIETSPDATTNGPVNVGETKFAFKFNDASTALLFDFKFKEAST